MCYCNIVENMADQQGGSKDKFTKYCLRNISIYFP